MVFYQTHTEGILSSFLTGFALQSEFVFYDLITVVNVQGVPKMETTLNNYNSALKDSCQ